ncbi:MAG: endonuclease Q family protein [Nanoarchaeota archaeon]
MIIADLQIHSRYARACSSQINIDNLEKWARIKGIDLLGTGDFQHPLWNKEIKEKLTEDENGILRTKTGFPFLWQTEVSLMYSQDGKGRRVHHLIFSPNKEVSNQIIEALGKKGRLDYDGRPIFGFSSIELVDMMLSISKDIEIIPAHCMTPWFGLFGSKSGFDSIKECFQDKSKYIHAVETGISADPPMLWRLDENVNLVSFSDAHSFWPWRLGRECTVFDTKLNYTEIINAIRTGQGLKETIEVNPAYGKYHYDGHRLCNINLSPKETRKLNGICPVCKKELTIGVEYRIEELAKQEYGYKTKNAKPFKSLIPLSELISAVYNYKQLSSKNVWQIYNKLIGRFGNEFNILLNAGEKDLLELADKKLVDIILLNREGKLKISPGFDGVYGTIILNQNETLQKQKSLIEF